jgi:selenide,water dikinase
VIGLQAPDRAAVARLPAGKVMVQTTSSSHPFIDDPWLFGRIAANHALSEMFAMGAEAHSATAIVTLPAGLESQAEETLFQTFSGAVEVLDAAACALVGGSVSEGREFAIGFTVDGLIDEHLVTVMHKGRLSPGEVLVLSKPLGTGILFGAHARFHARGRWIDDALLSMEQSNQLAAKCLREHGARVCSHVGACGLLGRLREMIRPSNVGAEIDLDTLPVLDGVAEIGVGGTLVSQPLADLRWREALRTQHQASRHPKYPLLFDPQTAGGLLASVPAQTAEVCVEALHSLGYGKAACIGRVLPGSEQQAPIRLNA